MKDDFAVFILSHGRADNVKTLKMLDKINYTGKTYIIIDDEDEQEKEYRKLKCTGVIQFSKKEEMKHTDTADNFNEHKLVVYARNKCHGIAKDLGLKYFLVLDDDYNDLSIRYLEKGVFKSKTCKNANKLFEATINFLEVSGALTVAYAQAGDYIGGADNSVYRNRLTRKAMNSFFCKTDRVFKFSGATNEDVNMYITYGNKGYKIFTIGVMCILQQMTQKQRGGLTDIYLQNGTYVKSFYSVIHQPQGAKISDMGASFKRIHHKIYANNMYPKIINEEYRKT